MRLLDQAVKTSRKVALHPVDGDDQADQGADRRPKRRRSTRDWREPRRARYCSLGGILSSAWRARRTAVLRTFVDMLTSSLPGRSPVDDLRRSATRLQQDIMSA